MLQPPILKITEIFASVQGEGLRQGEASLFIRFTGCNLKCPFCDTRYAWLGGTDMAAARVVEKIRAIRKGFPADWVCLTGGEPLLQDLALLIWMLNKERLRVQVETNGTVARDWPVDWWTISPKPPAWECAASLRKKAREVKLVVTRRLSFQTIKKIRGEFPLKTPIILQPQSNEAWSMKRALGLLKQAIIADLANIRLSVQLHKLYRLK